MSLQTINPATGKTVASFDEMTDAEIESALERSRRAFDDYRLTGFTERAAWLRQAADILENEKHQWAHLMTEEMGKTYQAALAEASKCAWVCRYYAEHGAGFLDDETITTDAGHSYVRYLPLGPVLAIMPWNFPFWQVMRFAAPALMAGNVALLKHAANVPQCARALGAIFNKAGFPADVFQPLLVRSNRVNRVISDQRIRALTLTGSETAGSQVASLAGRHIKKTVLELGGSDPFIVMPSANLDAAVTTAVKARTINNGQSCIAAKRFIIHADIYPEFEQRMVAELEQLKIGDPMVSDTDIGPLATKEIRDTVAQQVNASVQAGARLLTGGKPLPDEGFYYPPSALTDIPEHAPIYSEEVFGPVALLFKVNTLGEAIDLANSSDYGLGASVWTQEPEEQQRCINDLETGATFVNAMVASDPRLPFGGVKHSGYGRELAWHGIHEFTNAKTVLIANNES